MMTSLAKPVPAPRRRPLEQTPEGSLGSTEQMESEETANRPKPPIRPKPKVLPKPLSKSPSLEPGVVLPPSIPWSPKSPISEVPSAEKINLLTGPKPYGASAGGAGIRRPSFTLKRQPSEPLSGDEACSSTLAPVSKASVPVPLSPPQVDSVRLEPAQKEVPTPGPDGKDARPPVLKKPTVSFKVKPVPGAPKPSRFPGTTVDQILAKMEEDKGPVVGAGPERGWAQRTSASFDAGSRFGSTAYSSFRRSPSTSEGPREEGAGSPRAAGTPASPLFQGTATLGSTSQSHGLLDVKAVQHSDFPSDRCQERRTDSASTVTDHLKTTFSKTVPSEAPEDGPPTSSQENHTPEKISTASPEPQAGFTSVHLSETKKGISSSQHVPSDPWNEKLGHLQRVRTSAQNSLLDREPVSTVSVRDAPIMSEETPSASLDPAGVGLAHELTSSLLLGGVPLGPSLGLPLSEETSRASVETPLPASLEIGGLSPAHADSAVSSRATVENELASSLLVGGAPLGASSSELPAPKIISPRVADGAGMGSPPKVESSSSLGGGSHFLGRASHLMEHSYPMYPGNTPAPSEQSVGGMDWNLSESFEWNSPARCSEWALRRANLPAAAQNLVSDGAGLSAPHTDHALLGGPAHESKLSHGRGVDGSAELVTAGGRDQDLITTSVTAITDSSPKARLRTLPSEEAVDDVPGAIEFPKWERRQYSGEQARPPTLEKPEVEPSPATGMTMERERVDLVGKVSEGLVEAVNAVEEPQKESNIQRLKFDVFQAEEVFEPHTGTTALYQVETDPGIGHLQLASEVVDAQGLMEPLRPMLLSDPAAEPCVLYHGLAPMEHAIPSREDDSCLAMLEARGEHLPDETHYVKEEREPWCMVGTPEKSEAWGTRATQALDLEVSDFDPMRSQPEMETVLGAREPDSHWLEELLSPAPVSEDLEQDLKETPKSQEYEHGLLGWSQKDLESEFGPGGVEQLGLGKSVWEDQYGFEGTNQRQEVDIGNSDWSREHGIGESDWRKESETRITDWSTKHNIGEISQSEESGFCNKDWSVKHGMGKGDQCEEPETSTRDWASPQSMEERDQGEAHGIIGSEWSMKHSMEESDHGEEPRISSRDWYFRHSAEGTDQGAESGFGSIDWAMHPSVGETDQGAELVVSSKNISVKPSLEDSSKPADTKISHVLSETPIIGEPAGRSSGDWSVNHSVGFTNQSKESEPHSMDWSIEQTLNDQSRGFDARHRPAGESYTITLLEQHGDGVFRGIERGTHTGEADIGEIERGIDIGGIERGIDSREIGDGGTESRDIYEIRESGIEGEMRLEREMGDGEMESDVGVVERMADSLDVDAHRSYMPDGESSELRDSRSSWDSKNLEESSLEALQPEMPSSTVLEEMLGREATRRPTPAERPASLQSNQSQESESRPMDGTSPAVEEKEHNTLVDGSPSQSQPYLEKIQVQHEEGDLVDGKRMLAKEEAEPPEEMEDAPLDEVDFSFLEEAEILDCSLHRTRASLNRKRGHRAPTARPGAALNSTEVDGDEWMFQDSTEPKVPRPDSSEEEEAAARTPGEDVEANQEEQPQKPSKKSPISLGKKMGIFAGFNPSALKAKLKSRKSAEEGEQPKSPRQKDNFQRSKSCKLPAESGKPLVLPPKPEKPAGSESSSPQWLNALKLKKKPQK